VRAAISENRQLTVRELKEALRFHGQ
jgi:hypothetical protein